MFLRGLNGLVVSVHFGLLQEHALSILHMSSFRVILTYLSAYLNTTPTYAYTSIHEYVKIYEYLVQCDLVYAALSFKYFK